VPRTDQPGSPNRARGVTSSHAAWVTRPPPGRVSTSPDQCAVARPSALTVRLRHILAPSSAYSMNGNLPAKTPVDDPPVKMLRSRLAAFPDLNHRDCSRMPTLQYCWRCRIEVPMLDEAEWAELAPFLSPIINRIQSYREQTGASLSDATKLGYEQPALAKYFELSGFRESNVNALWHHRLSQHGPPCPHCGKLLRTNRSARCVECGSGAHAVA